MEKVSKLLDGKKTFLVCGLMVVYALLGLFLGDMGQQEAVKLLLEAGALAGLRVGINKK